MIRRICGVLLLAVFCVTFVGCAEDEIRTTNKVQSESESQPRDVSPGYEVVE